jgi:glutamate-ammonia-ligase adenylyltransferase
LCFIADPRAAMREFRRVLKPGGWLAIGMIPADSPWGRLYELDTRLRPAGAQGPIAVSLADFSRSFRQEETRTWERQSLCKARPIYGSERVRDLAQRAVRQAIQSRPWTRQDGLEIRETRRRLEESASPMNLKRAPGGTMDIEFIVQGTQLRVAQRGSHPLETGTLAALEGLSASNDIDPATARELADSYRYLRRVEARLRLMDTSARHDLPRDECEISRLAFLLNSPSPATLVDQCTETMANTRRIFGRVTSEWCQD